MSLLSPFSLEISIFGCIEWRPRFGDVWSKPTILASSENDAGCVGTFRLDGVFDFFFPSFFVGLLVVFEMVDKTESIMGIPAPLRWLRVNILVVEVGMDDFGGVVFVTSSSKLYPLGRSTAFFDAFFVSVLLRCVSG